MSRRSKTIAASIAVAGCAITLGFMISGSQDAERSATTAQRVDVKPARVPAGRPALRVGALAVADDEDDETPKSTAVPYIGPVHRQVNEEGVVVQYQEIEPGYVQRDSDGEEIVDLDPEPAPVPSLPVNRTPVDPTAFGAASLDELEARVRRQFRVPGDQRVELWMEERDGKMGLAIDTLPPGPIGTEQMLEETSGGSG